MRCDKCNTFQSTRLVRGRDANGELYYELVCLPCESILLTFQLPRGVHLPFKYAVN